MAIHQSLRAVQQSLAVRGIICRRVEPYSDGRCRFGVWPQGKRYLAQHTDDVDAAYIKGLRMS